MANTARAPGQRNSISVRASNTVKKLIDHFEPRASADRKLVPPGLGATMRADWKLFHSEHNTATTVFAYHHLLPHRDIMVGPLSEGALGWEVAAVERFYPLFEGMLRALLRAPPTSAPRAPSKRSAACSTAWTRGWPTAGAISTETASPCPTWPSPMPQRPWSGRTPTAGRSQPSPTLPLAYSPR